MSNTDRTPRAQDICHEQAVAASAMAAMQQQLAALTTQFNVDKVTRAVDDAIAAGKLVPAQREWALALGGDDMAALASFVAAAPVIRLDGIFRGFAGDEPEDGQDTRSGDRSQAEAPGRDAAPARKCPTAAAEKLGCRLNCVRSYLMVMGQLTEGDHTSPARPGAIDLVSLSVVFEDLQERCCSIEVDLLEASGNGEL